MAARRPVAHRVMVGIGVIAVTLGLAPVLAEYAHAATPAPRTRCGAVVVWGVAGSQASPDGIEAAITSAYKAVRPIARVGASQGFENTTSWAWIDRGGGDPSAAGDAEITTLLGSRTVWVHSHLPTAADTSTTGLRTLVLRDVLHDLGLNRPTSGATLSQADRKALTAICTAQAKATVKPTPTLTPKAKTPDRETVVAQQSGSSVNALVAWPVGALVVGLIAFWVTPRPLVRGLVRPLVRRVRARRGGTP